MKSLVRLLLVCFLLLALPFQAFAQASMRPLAAPAQQHKQHPRQHPQQPPCHQQMGLQHGQRDHMATAAGTHDGHAAEHAKGKCGTCAACCVGAAMAPSLPVALTLAPSGATSIPFRAGHLPSVDPVLPERPPSTLFA